MASRFFRNPLDAVLIETELPFDRYHIVELHSGVKLALRGSDCLSVPDICILREVLADDEYLLGRSVRIGDTVVDVGAHVGFYSVLAAARCGGGGEVLAFEPEPSNFQMLQLNARLNRALPIRTFNRALSSCSAQRQLSVSRTNTGGHTLLKRSSDNILVSCLTLGDVLRFARLNTIDVLKLDCEGAEFQIVDSTAMEDLRRIEVITMEVHEAEYTRRGDVDALFSKLSESGFSLEVLRRRAYVGEGRFQVVCASRKRG